MTSPLLAISAAMYQNAVAMWPDLTPAQFREAALAWLDKETQPLSIENAAVGIQQELRARYGSPARPST